jgi:hypothetical protein
MRYNQLGLRGKYIGGVELIERGDRADILYNTLAVG